MSLSEWWQAGKELNRLYKFRPYSYWLVAGGLLAAILGILGYALIRQGINARGWYVAATVAVPSVVYHWGLLLWLVRRGREQRRDHPS